MPTSDAMKDALKSNVGFFCPIWKIISRDGVVAAYAAHTRTTVGRAINPGTLFTFNSVTYRPAPVEATRDMHRIGLNPNSTQIKGVFDNIITRPDLEGGRWKMAKVVYEYVNYLDLSMGSASKMVGIVGSVEQNDPVYQMEVLTNASLLAQLIGELTSSLDRNAFPAGVDKADWIVTRNVVSSADRRHLVIDGAAKDTNYFKYGVIFWTTGANVHSPGMEIKSSTGNSIELQLPMPDDIANGDHVTLLAGYDGTRGQIRDRFADAIDMNAEPDLPGQKVVFSYPES